MSNATLASPKLIWPQGHRVAVVVSVLLETWSEKKSPSYFPRTTPLPPGSTDIAGINWSRFGGNEGIWRLSRNLKDLDIPATLFCNGRSAEVWPEAVAAFAKAGHDVAAHGYLQDQTLFSMSAEIERETIKKTLDILEKTAGKRPTGWVTPIYGWSENTIDYLAEAKLAWCSDALDATAPYWKDTKSGKILMIPWSDFVDNRALRASPRIYYDVYKDMFDYLHACGTSLSFRRPPGDDSDVPHDPGIFPQPQGCVVRTSPRSRKVDRRPEDRGYVLRQPLLQIGREI